jgi:hypothetical protein
MRSFQEACFSLLPDSSIAACRQKPELVFPVHFRRKLHYEKQGENRSDRDRKPGESFKEESV